ncbi:c-type cytochrome [Calidithermus roseus]|uniref:Cytochrome c-552 n=1 Tax=Calidithermus roseus TaxID=1644118 RepID=A0A399ET53_9DEIN|nr:cytochrome c [Calidithermus roseus]RIH86753.1 Cytochrome c-552 [Calidithermus roseus]
MKKSSIFALVTAGIAAVVVSAQPSPQTSNVYQQCQGCHQTNGTGIPGVFPPLAGHVPQVLAAKGGREYLINVLLYGLAGEISVKGQKYSGAMPPFAQLTDEQLAGVLNHISTQWGNDKALPKDFKLFNAAEVKAKRATKLSQAQVLELRKKLELK